MKKHSLFNRILSGILAIVLFLGCIPTQTFADDGEGFRILGNTRASGPITFPYHEKVTITAAGYPDGADLQWQIAMPGGGWVDIMGQEEDILTLSYALVANVMDETGLTSVRCESVSGNLCQYTTPVGIRVLPEEEQTVYAAPVIPTEEVAAATEVTEVATEETTVPTEETVAATEETTAPTEETVAATEETTASTEETVIPTEETTVPTEGTTVPTEETVPTTEETTAPTEETVAYRVADNAGQPSLASAVPQEELPTFVTITINYLWNDPNDMTDNYVPLVEPYIANILKGATLTVDEPMPNRPGYKPTIDGNDWTTPRYTRTFSEAETTDDIEVNVIYVQVPVDFYVRYFLQNVTDDLYTEWPEASQKLQASGVFTGYEGQSPDKNKIDLKKNSLTQEGAQGFSSLFIQPDEIAADGSTVFEFYYDRLYYLMSFDMDGGFGTEPVYARFGTEFTIPAPEKPGWIFNGWELVKVNGQDVTDSNGDGKPGNGENYFGDPVGEYTLTMPSESRTYKALWTTTQTSYTVVYWREKTDPVDYTGMTKEQKKQNYEYWGSIAVKGEDVLSGQKVNITRHVGDNIPVDITRTNIDIQNNSGQLVKLDERRFFTYNADLTDQDVLILGDGSTVVNVYYDRKEYTLKFYYAMETKEDEEKGTQGHQHIYVVGGSTYFFGSLAKDDTEKNDEKELLSFYLTTKDDASTARGTIVNRPEFNDKGNALLTKTDGTGYVKPAPEEVTVADSDFGDYKLHYFYFKAKYNADISELWPCDVFKPATRANTSTNYNDWNGDQAFVSAWNGEYNVYYSRRTSNQTIKGNYQRLDYKLLWADADPADNTVSYLCFWENGTENSRVDWSIPRLWYYCLWVPVQDGENPAVKKERNGITYKLVQDYPTCDDSGLSGQTQVALEGFTGGGSEAREELSTYDALTFLKTKGYTEQSLSTNYKTYHVANFYYTRNTYSLKFYDLHKSNDPIEEKTLSYEKSLAGYFFEPEYPTNLEPNAYFFAGWYTTPLCLPGTEFGTMVDSEGNTVVDPFANETMPSKDVALYAKWEPYTYDVYFYADLDALKADTDIEDYFHPNVPHGGHINTGDNKQTIPLPEPATGNAFEDYIGYDFMGWFYLDENNEKVAFDPNSMEIRRDMKLYADWQIETVTKYEVYYVKAEVDADGKPVTDANGNWKPLKAEKLAGNTENLIFTGTTKTFKAKGIPREDENDPIWLPQTNSHSILMKPPVEEDENGLPVAPQQNKYYFCYVSRTTAPYRVEYLDAETGDPIPKVSEKLVPDNKNAVVSEMPIFIEGYTAKEAYKTLVLSANTEENVIRFFYTKNEENDPKEHYYLVHHYVEDDGGTFEVDENGNAVRKTYGDFSIHETKGYKATVGSDVSAQPLTITGYEYQEGFDQDGYEEVKEGKVTTDSMLELKLYYTRPPYPYVIKHLVYGATNETLVPLPDDYTGGEKRMVGYMPYDATLTGNALKDIPGYELVGDVDNKSLRIAIDTMTQEKDPDLNVIEFYYKARETEILYTPKCTEPSVDVSKWLSILSERTVSYTDIRGSTPHAVTGFDFKGWFKDEACTVPVVPDVINSNGDVETKNDGTLGADNKWTPHVDVTLADENGYKLEYYALFEPVKKDLKIRKVGVPEGIKDSFIFTVTGTNVLGQPVNLTVSIQGNGEVTIEDLYCGDYTVTETDWSWEYDCAGVSINDGPKDASNSTAVVLNVDTPLQTIIFDNDPKHVDWLHGESCKENVFESVS